MLELKTQYRYIHFEKIEDKPRTSVWGCLNSKHGYPLGTVAWRPAWRRYCYTMKADTEYSAECLHDIGDFCEQLNEAQKIKG